MTAAATNPEPPPLAPPEARAILRKLGDLTEEIVLVGGQALAFWAELYASTLARNDPALPTDSLMRAPRFRRLVATPLVALICDLLGVGSSAGSSFSVSP